MKNVLFVKSSIKGNQSLSSQLGDAIVNKLRSKEDVLLTVRDVAADMTPHLDMATFATLSTPAEKWSDEDRKRAFYSETVVAELAAAEIIVISVAMHQFTIPSTLKTWLDNASRAGKTFSYSAAGPKGLLTDKKVYLAISTGGIYSAGPMAALDFTESYLRAVLGFLGMTDVTAYRVEGSAMPEFKEMALTKAVSAVLMLS